MAHDFCTFVVGDDRRAALIEELDSKVQKYWKLADGVAMGPLFPPTVEIRLAKAGGDLVGDFVDNIHTVVIVSEKARKVLEAEGVRGEAVVEYLPFVLRDKKRKKVPGQFAVVNALRLVPCLDREKSVFETFPGSDEIVSTSVKRILLHAGRIPADANLFRIAELPSQIAIRSDLVEKLKAAGCTGLSVLPCGERLP